MIKLFASDLDGTLLNAHHQFDERIVQGIRDLLDQGAEFSIATGRGPKQCTIPEIERDVYKICMNGALILDKENAILHMELFPKDILSLLIDEFYDLPFDFVTPEKTYTMHSQEAYVRKKVDINDDDAWKERFMRDFLPRMEFNASKEEILHADVCKVNMRTDQHKSYVRLTEFLDVHQDQILNAPSSEDLIELTAVNSQKGNAVAILAKHLGLKDDEVAVYGDGGNDLSMLSRFSHSYAPENACLAAKEKARSVIGPAFEYSVIKHMEEISKS